MDDKVISAQPLYEVNEEGFHSLYKQYYKLLVCLAAKIVSDLSVAEDIVQDIFSRLWEKQQTFHSPIALQSYLYKAVKNSSLDFLKHQSVEGHYQDIVLSNQQVQPIDNEDDWFSSEEVYRLLLHSIDELPERCREVFLLMLKGKKNKEIAEILNISIETVKTQKKKGLAVLRTKLDVSSLIFLNIILLNS